MTSYLIGKIEGNIQLQKYIVEFNNDTYTYYANEIHDINHPPFHIDIALKNKINSTNIVGGGVISYKNQTLTLSGHSIKFGKVKKEILENLSSRILEEYAKINKKIKEIKIE